MCHAFGIPVAAETKSVAYYHNHANANLSLGIWDQVLGKTWDLLGAPKDIAIRKMSFSCNRAAICPFVTVRISFVGTTSTSFTVLKNYRNHVAAM